MRLEANCAISALAKLYCGYFNSDLLQSIFCPVYPKKIELISRGYACISLIGFVKAKLSSALGKCKACCWVKVVIMRMPSLP